MANGISYKIYDTVTQVPIALWQSAVPRYNLLHQTAYMQLLESNLRGKTGFVYAIIEENEAPIGVCYFQVVRFTGEQLKEYTKNSPPFKAFVQNVVLQFVDVTMLVGANVFMSGEKGIFWIKDLSSKEQATLYTGLLKHLFNSKKELDAFLMTDVFTTDSDLKVAFEAINFHSIYEEPDMVMHINPEWKKFDDYLSAQSSKYRVRTKRCLVLSQDIERKELSTEEVRQYEQELYTLYENTMKQASFSLAKLQLGYCSAQKEMLPDCYHLFGYFLDGKLVGFNSLFCINGKGEVHYVGLNYEINKTTHLYQRMLYDMVQCGIEKGLEQLHFGRTATEIKSTIGAVPVEVNGYLYHKNRLINSMLIKPLSKAIKPKDFVFRNPFKG